MERQPLMMQEYLKFTDLMDSAKSSSSRSYNEIEYEQAGEMKKSLDESLSEYNAIS